jgi:hypothetical protein
MSQNDAVSNESSDSSIHSTAWCPNVNYCEIQFWFSTEVANVSGYVVSQHEVCVQISLKKKKI